jgi:DNA repair exonuclease SbcCD nuclease subunit
MAKFTFIHAADLHIESPYKGVRKLNQALGQALVEQGIKAYESLIDLALTEQVDFLLIAGDSFDSESGSLSAQYRFVRGLERLNDANIRVFIICGNHDPLNSWSSHLKLPENTVLFQAEEVAQHTVFKGQEAIAEVYGVSYGQKEEYNNLARLFKRNDKASFSIGLLHGTIAGNEAHTPYCPFDMDNLRASNMDYWALGHIHKREILSDKNPTVVYSGNIQGRHFNETGEKGCSLVTVDHGEVVAHSFQPLSNIVYEYAELNTEGFESLSAFTSAIEELKQDLNPTTSFLLRLRLKGKTSLHSTFSNQAEIQALIDELNGQNNYHQRFIFIDKCINETIPNINLEERKKSSDFIADLIQRFDDYESDEQSLDQLKKKIIDEIASSKVGRELNDINFEEEVSKEMTTLLETAKWRCLDGLIEQQET